MRLFVILNPWAGRGLAGQRRDDLERALKESGLDYTLYATHARGGATELAWQAIERGYTHIAAVGGDGTLNEVVNGIMGSRQSNGKTVPLAIIPLGTGCDFVKSLPGVSAGDIYGALQRIKSGQLRSIDIGVANGRYFINAANMGLDAQVTYESQRLTHLKGFAVYLAAVIFALANYRAYPMRVRFGSYEFRRRLLFTTVSNGRCQGGGFYVTPNAQLDDGQLDICLIDRMRLDEIVRNIPRLMEGTHTTMRQVTLGLAQRVVVDSAGPIPFAVDGEILATDARHVEIDMIPQALEIMA